MKQLFNLDLLKFKNRLKLLVGFRSFYKLRVNQIKKNLNCFITVIS